MLTIGSIRPVIDKSWPWGEATDPSLTVPVAVMPPTAAPIVAFAGGAHQRNEQHARLDVS